MKGPKVAVIRAGKLLAVGTPDALRERAGGQRVEIIGRGFSESVLSQLRAQPAVAAAEVQNDHLIIDLRTEADTAPWSACWWAQGCKWRRSAGARPAWRRSL